MAASTKTGEHLGLVESVVAVVSGITGITSFIIDRPTPGILLLSITGLIVWMWIFPYIARWKVRLASALSVLLMLTTFTVGLEISNTHLMRRFWHTVVDCSRPSGTSGGIKSPVNFVNTSDEAVSLYWINENGDEIFYNDVLPGGIQEENTFLNHSWCIRDKQTKAAIQSVVAAGDKTRVAIIR